MNRIGVIAHHEAGHAVAAVAFGRGVRSVAIDCANGVDDQLVGGALTTYTSIRPPDSQHDPARVWRARRDLLLVAAGPAAEAKYTKRSTRFVLLQPDARFDMELIANLLIPIGGWNKTIRYIPKLESEHVVHDVSEGIEELLAAADLFVHAYWPAVKLLARELIETRHLSGNQVRRIVLPHITSITLPVANATAYRRTGEVLTAGASQQTLDSFPRRVKSSCVKRKRAPFLIALVPDNAQEAD